MPHHLRDERSPKEVAKDKFEEWEHIWQSQGFPEWEPPAITLEESREFERNNPYDKKELGRLAARYGWNAGL